MLYFIAYVCYVVVLVCENLSFSLISVMDSFS